MEKRHCAYCDGVIAGRTDKKFCNSACRNAFHNESLAGYLKKIRPVIQVLQRNRKILLEIIQSGEPVSKQSLIAKGFEPSYCTEHIIRDNQEYNFCFDVGYKSDGEHIIPMLRNQLAESVNILPEITRQLISLDQSAPDQRIKKKL